MMSNEDRRLKNTYISGYLEATEAVIEVPFDPT
jgi:hypothetical protein